VMFTRQVVHILEALLSAVTSGHNVLVCQVVHNRTVVLSIELLPSLPLSPLNAIALLGIMCTEPGLFATRKASTICWSYSIPISGKMVVVSNRYDRPSSQQLEPPSRKGSPHHLLFFHMCRWYMAGSAEYWPNITLNLLASHPGRSPVSFILWRMACYWGLQGFTAYSVGVVRCTPDRLVDL